MNSAVVTGASSGIGAATCERLLADGWAVVGLDVDITGFQKLAANHSEHTRAVEGSVDTRTSHQAAAAAATELAPLTAWVNNAAIESPTRGHDFDDEVFDGIMKVNCYGAAYGCSVALQSFLDSGQAGAIVNVSSVRGHISIPGGFAYEASKGAVEQMTRSIAVQYGHLGIRCNGVRPGVILTPMSEKADPRLVGPEREEALTELGRLQPLPSVGMPEWVADAIVYLLSDQSRFVSGTMLNVDGALTAQCFVSDPAEDICFRTQ